MWDFSTLRFPPPHGEFGAQGAPVPSSGPFDARRPVAPDPPCASANTHARGLMSERFPTVLGSKRVALATTRRVRSARHAGLWRGTRWPAEQESPIAVTRTRSFSTRIFRTGARAHS